MRKFVSGILLVVMAGTAPVVLAASPSVPGARVYLIAPAHGEVVEGPVTVKFGLHAMGVAPAGIERPKTGHHHLLIDVDSLPALDRPLPKDERHRHYGGGQTQAVLNLAPGEHTLQLVFADHRHIPHDPPLISKKITITVK